MFGLLYRVPGAIGVRIAGALAFLPLLGGLLMTLIVIGLALGWPLMPVIVAAEGEDGFDALSRSYSYVNQRRWRYAFLIGLAWLIGCAGLLFVDLFARIVVQLTHWALPFARPRPGARRAVRQRGDDPRPRRGDPPHRLALLDRPARATAGFTASSGPRPRSFIWSSATTWTGPRSMSSPRPQDGTPRPASIEPQPPTTIPPDSVPIGAPSAAPTE